MTIKIAVTGEIRSGKDTVCDLISEGKHGSFVKLAFADGIKRVIHRDFPSAFVYGKKPRKHYQVIGQAYRQLNPEYWIESLNNLYTFFEEKTEFNILVTDLRQPNEYQWLKDNGFIVIKVESDKDIRIKRMVESGDVFSEEDLNHESEQAIKSLPYDYLITNNSTKFDLEKQVRKVLNDISGNGG